MRILVKKCRVCGKKFIKGYYCSRATWKKQTTGFAACRHKWISGRRSPNYGRKLSRKEINRLRRALSEKTSGELHSRWKGDKVGHSALHRWLRRHYPKKGICDYCGRKEATH